MECRLSELRRKEVISVADGVRLGMVDDVIVDTKTACVVAFVIFNRFSFFGWLKNQEDYIIPWEKIELIGEDAVIVSCKLPKPQKSQKKRLFFWKN